MTTSIHDLRGMVRASKRRARRAAGVHDALAYRRAREKQHLYEYELKIALGESKLKQHYRQDERERAARIAEHARNEAWKRARLERFAQRGFEGP